jgi:hypothetical protein
MANRVHTFKHRDVMRVVKAARAAGVEVGQVTVNPTTGAITVGPAPKDNGAANPLDKWIESRADQVEGR